MPQRATMKTAAARTAATRSKAPPRKTAHAPVNAPTLEAAAVVTPKKLPLRIDSATYTTLRAYCYHTEFKTGSVVSHQTVLVQALKSWLASQSMPR